jgi:hypothetical protein
MVCDGEFVVNNLTVECESYSCEKHLIVHINVSDSLFLLS